MTILLFQKQCRGVNEQQLEIIKQESIKNNDESSKYVKMFENEVQTLNNGLNPNSDVVLNDSSSNQLSTSSAPSTSSEAIVSRQPQPTFSTGFKSLEDRHYNRYGNRKRKLSFEPALEVLEATARSTESPMSRVPSKSPLPSTTATAEATPNYQILVLPVEKEKGPTPSTSNHSFNLSEHVFRDDVEVSYNREDFTELDKAFVGVS